MKNLPLHIKIVIGLIAGIIWAFVSSYLGWNEFTITWIDPFGTIFIRALKYIAVPLVLFSIISGVSSLTDVSKLGRLGAKNPGFISHDHDHRGWYRFASCQYRQTRGISG